MPIWRKRKSYILQIVNLDSPLDMIDYSYPLYEEFRIEDDKVKKEPILQALFHSNKEVKLYNKNLFKYLKDLNALLELDNAFISIDDVITAIWMEIENLYVNENYNQKYNFTNPPQRWFYIYSNRRPNILNDQLFKILFEYINIDVKCIDTCESSKRFIYYELNKIIYNLQKAYLNGKRKGKDMNYSIEVFNEPVNGMQINFYHEINLTEEDIKKEPIFQALFYDCHSFKIKNSNLYQELLGFTNKKEKFIKFIKEDLNDLHVICTKYNVFVSKYKYITKEIIKSFLQYVNVYYQNEELAVLLGTPFNRDRVPYFSTVINKLKKTFCKNKEENKMDKEDKNNIITCIRDALKKCNIKNGNVTVSIETENTEKIDFKIEEDSLKSLIDSGELSINELKNEINFNKSPCDNLNLNILINKLCECPEKIRINNDGDYLYIPTVIDKFNVYLEADSCILNILVRKGYNLKDIIPILEDEFKEKSYSYWLKGRI